MPLQQKINDCAAVVGVAYRYAFFATANIGLRDERRGSAMANEAENGILANFLRTGIPGPDGSDRFCEYIIARYDKSGEKAQAYLDRLIDRVINKGRGVVSFNSLGMAVIALLSRYSLPDWQKYLLACAIGLLVFSSLSLLWSMFWGFFGSIEDYRYLHVDCRETARLLMRRAIWLNWSVLTSSIAFLFTAVTLGILLLGDPSPPNLRATTGGPATSALHVGVQKAPNAAPSPSAGPKKQ